MKYSKIILTLIWIVILFVLRTSDAGEIVRDKWYDYSHDKLIKKITPVEESDSVVIYNKSNLANYGKVLETKDYNYIVFDSMHLEKTDKDLNTLEVLISEKEGYSIGRLQLKDDYLYYSRNGLYRMNIKTKAVDHLYSKNISDFIVHKNEIYLVDYKRGLNLFKMGLNGDKLEKIYDGSVYNLWYEDDGLYCLLFKEEGNQLIHIKDNEVHIVVESISASVIQQLNRDLYYIDTETSFLVKMNLDSKKKDIIIDKEVYRFALDNNDLYYSLRVGQERYYEGKGIYRLTQDGDTILLDDETILSVGNLNLLGDYIFYESDYRSNPFKNTLVKKDGSDKKIIDKNQNY